MIFKKIELQGFKSFAEKTTIELKEGITAVVGPNGSGKSNISDAIRWVLGEQSLKSLRGQKSQDIIFSGTQIRKSLGFAEVAIYIDNKSRRLNLEYDEVVVKRRLYRDGTSSYYLNNNECRLKTIQELFMDTGIGKDGYSIIGQGRIDEILSNKSDERRHIFEEASGIVKYRFRKEESEKKIEKTKLNLQRVNDILSEIESNISSLEEQSETAKKYLNLRDELKKLEILNFSLKLEKLKQDENKVNENKEEITATYKEEVNVIDINEKEINNLKERIDSIVIEIEKIQNLDFETKEKITKMLNKVEMNKQRIADSVENKDRFQNEKELAEQKLIELEKERETQQNKILNFDKDAEEFHKELTEKEKELKKLMSSLSDIEIKRSQKKEEISQLIDERYESENTKLNILMQIQNLEDNIKQKKKEESEIVSHLDELRINQQEKSSKHFNIKKQKEDLEKTIEEIKEELNKKFEDEENVKEKHQSLKTEIMLKKSRLELLENLEKDQEGFNYAIKKLMEEAEKKSNYGKLVDSVLANILTLDEKYQVAIEMALGYSLQNIVVEKEEDAKELIEFLKQNKYGRASFLPLNTIKGYKLEDSKINKGNIDGIVEVAANLVKYNTKYTNIINYLLGQIVIVKDNNTAIQLARLNKYRFKIITLEGDIINPSGVMTGGSLNKTSGKVLGRKNEIKNLGNEISKLETNILEVEEQKNKSQIIREEVSKRFEENKTKRDKLVSEYEIYFQTEAIADKEIEKLEKNLKDTRKLKEEYSISKSEKENEKLEEEQKIIDITKNIEEIENIIEKEMQVNPVDAEKLDDLNYDIANLKISISSFDESKNSITEILGMLEGQIKEQRNIKEDREKRLSFGKEQQIELEEEISKLYSKIEEIQSSNTDFSKETETLRKEREEKNIIIKKLELENKDRTERLTDIKDQMSKYMFNLEKIEMQKDDLILYMWEEYEITPNSEILKEYIKLESNITKSEDNNEDINNENNINNENKEKEAKLDNKRIKQLKQEIKEIGSVNIDAIEEYKKIKERYDFLVNQKSDLEKSISSLKEIIIEMQKIMKEQFELNFKQINVNFNNVFQELFGGGKAEVILENGNNSLESGIEIKVEPPGKKLQSLSLLSGGERALTAIALLFAILSINPSPFCVLDEIESALDESNVSRYARFLKSYSKNTQFLMITHRKGSMEIADNIYGVTMQESGISTIVSMSLKAAQKTGKK